MCLSRNASETCTWSFYVSAVSFYVARLHGLHVHVKFADIRFQYKGLKVSLQVYMHVQVCHPIKEFGRVWHRRSCQIVQYVYICRNSIHDYLCSMLQYMCMQGSWHSMVISQIEWWQSTICILLLGNFNLSFSDASTCDILRWNQAIY